MVFAIPREIVRRDSENATLLDSRKVAASDCAPDRALVDMK
jgi:hypothetical protein